MLIFLALVVIIGIVVLIAKLMGKQVTVWPQTRPGRWSMWLMVIGFVMSLVLAGGIGALALHLAAVVLAIVALTQKDRGLVLAIPVVTGLFWLLFILGELLIGHD